MEAINDVTPYCVIDLPRMRKNAAAMLERAHAHGVQLRPHVKTHKTVPGALVQTGGARERIVVSTLAEAAHFAESGFDDILYGIPITPDKLQRALPLQNALNRFNVLIDSHETYHAVRACSANKPWRVWLKVDCGYHRAGVDPSSDGSVELAKSIATDPATRLAGIYVHAGMSYDCADPATVTAVATRERDAVVAFAARLRAAGLAGFDVAMGSTPTCSHLPASLEGITEIHPGNYILYDVMQTHISSCSVPDIAVAIVVSIVSVYPDRNELLIDAGWTALTVQGANKGYGLFDDHPELQIKKMSQESSVVAAAPGAALDVSQFRIGQKLAFRPWHACVISALFARYHVLDGGVVVDQWTPCRGW
eukprot:m.46010 g.46010  ORF g.46010 m.46010 type:complete len:365 (-) comp5907_c0_seq3:108-1202(-)